MKFIEPQSVYSACTCWLHTCLSIDCYGCCVHDAKWFPGNREGPWKWLKVWPVFHNQRYV